MIKSRTLAELIRKRLEIPINWSLADHKQSIGQGQLSNIVTRLSAFLIKKGLKKGDRVAIYLPKSSEAVCAVYSILISGGIYVPIEFSQPKKRIDFLLKSSTPKLLITSQKCSDLFQNYSKIQTIIWEDLEKVLSSEEKGIVVEIEPSDGAYILFTSGSTGNPKGVLHSHGSAMAFVNWAGDFFELDSNDVFCSHSPLHFGISIFDLFVPVVFGAKFTVLDEKLSFLSRHILAFLKKWRVTVWYSVPTVLMILGRNDEFKEGELFLKLIMFAGEPFPVKDLSVMVKRFPSCGFFNLYGATETNVSIAYKVETDFFEQDHDSLPLGVLLPHFRDVSLVADKNQPFELELEGESLMRNYWSLNNSVEIKSFKTGDRVQLKEGVYCFLGRSDTLVKIYGNRINLREVEEVVRKCPGASHVVCVRIKSGKIEYLTAYFTGNPALCDEDLRLHCSKFLPPYMVPREFRYLEEFPRNQNGKIDRLKLQEVESGE